MGDYRLKEYRKQIGTSSWPSYCTLVLAGLAAVSLFAAAGTFPDVAAEAGLSDVFYCGRDDQKDYILETLGAGVALFDYDNDGYLDAFFVTGSTMEGFPAGKHPSNQLYRNQRNGTFAKVTRSAGLGSDGWGQGACAGDYDNDGFDDLFVTNFGVNHLYRNNGNGSFEDVTERAGLPGAKRWSTGCAFLDYNLDGRLDLFVANYIIFEKERIPARGTAPSCRWKGQAVLCGPRGLPGETNDLYKNLGDGRFQDVSEESGVAAIRDRYSLSVTTFDFNLDGWPDIYVAVDSKPSILFRNNGDGTFEDVAVFAGVAFNDDGREQAGMGTAAGDFDGDRQQDLVKTNFIDDVANLYRNNGDESFTDLVYSHGMGKNSQYLGWGVGFLDFDNDTWPDLFMVNGHVHPEIEPLVPGNPYRQRRILYRNIEGKRFEDVSGQVGGGVTAPHSSRGLALGDFDNDGDVDIFINNMNEQPSLLRNDGRNLGGFLSIRLQGVKSNRNGVGALVTVSVGDRRMIQEVRSGSTFMSHSDFRLHFGLGDAKSVDKIEIQWPYADSVETLTGVAANQFITITEGSGITKPTTAAGSSE